MITASFAWDLRAGALNHQSWNIASNFQRFIYIGFQGRGLAPARGLIRCDDQLGFASGDTGGQSLR